MDVSDMPDNSPPQPEPAPAEVPPQAPPEPAQPPQPAPSMPQQEVPQPTSYEETYQKPRFEIKIPQPRILLSAAAFIIIVAIIVLVAPSLLTPSNTTLTTTVQQVNLSRISGCETLSQPGTYYLESNINDTATHGACLVIASSGVKLIGNQYQIVGNGPYTDVPPFSYGIELRGASNANISSVYLARFSYDLFLNGSSDSVILSNNLTNATLSGIYVVNSYNNTIRQNDVLHSQSTQGGIYVKSGRGNSFINNTVSNNAYYGFSVNSTGNNFTQNIFSGNPADFVCNATSASKYSNSFSNSRCTVNDYCGFASCSTNVPFNVSSIRLSPGQVSTCGSIYSPGNYTLSKSVSTATYLNASNPLAKGVSCIQILAPNVNFNCANKQINNSGYGIYIGSSTNVNVSKCVLYNDNYGLFAASSFSPGISNVTAINDTYGIFISNTTGGRVSNANLINNNTYGLFINSSSGILFNNIRASNNTYGVYVSSGGSNVFNGGVSNNNTKADIYCSPATYNSTTNLAQSFSCGVTDCTWASSSCSQTVQPSLAVFPVSSCRAITTPGNYSLNQNILTSGTCFIIQSNNVVFNCKSHSITGASSGSAFQLSGRRNVSISNCAVSKFTTAVNVTNSTQIDIGTLTANNTAQGVVFSRVSGSTVTSDNIRSQSGIAFNFVNVNTSTISNNLASLGVFNGTGFVFNNADHNKITFNNATSNPGYGFQFVNSENDTVYNNSAFNNVKYDYACSGTSAGLYSSQISVNFGLTKSGCNWLVALSPLISGPSCQAIFTPTQLTFNRDLLYTPGTTCFSIFTTTNNSANDSSIDCAGHTIYAPNGGTFANIFGSANVKISDCLLWNFSTGVQSTGLSTIVYNNTFAAGGNAVVLNGGRFSSIYRNTVDNNTNGMIISNVSQVSVYNNNFFNNTLSMAFFNSTFSTITNNTAVNSAVGLYLGNATVMTLQNNVFQNSSLSSITCAGSAGSTGSKNIDDGGNVCQKGQTTCLWMSKSTSCKA